MFGADGAGISDDDFRLHEADATKFLVRHFTSQLCQTMSRRADNAIIEQCVVQPFTQRGGTPGDIDLIFYDSAEPKCTAACEIKIVTKNVANIGNNFVGGLAKLTKGVEQCAGLLSLGFGQVYLIVVMLGNVSHSENNLPTRTLSLSDWFNIRNRFHSLVGDRRIGLINVEICQSSARSIDVTGNISAYCVRSFTQRQKSRVSELSAQRIREIGCPNRG